MSSLSIIISTRDRCRLLAPLVECFDHKVILPASFSLEVLLIDNGSTDGTKEAVKSLISMPRKYALRYDFEKKPGLSNARNRGISAAMFDKLCFLDDDALPENDFLQVISSTFDIHPDIPCFAHRVITYHVNRPEWYCLEGRYRMLNRGTYDLGAPSRFLTGSDPSPIGSGMIISRPVFSQLGGFDPGFGYDLSRSMMVPGEESEFFFKVRDKGIPIFYIHDAVINHYPKEEKYDVHSLCKTYKGIGFWYGSVDARNLRHKTIKTLAGYPRSYYKRFIKTWFNFIYSQFSSCKTVKYYHLFKWEETLGYFKGYSAFRKRSNGQNA